MDNIIVPPKKNLRPELSKTLLLMIQMLETEHQIWADKTQGKTVDSIIRCKTALEVAENFADENDWKGFTYVMMQNISVETLKTCFYRQKEKQKQILKLYKDANEIIVKWMKLINKN